MLPIMALFAVLGFSGCDNRSESEKMMDQMNKDAKKAAAQIKKDINNI